LPVVPFLLDAAIIVKPETLVRWHRGGFRLFFRWQSQRRAGRCVVSSDIGTLVRQLSRENLLWDVPRIHGELLKLGIEISQSSVAQVHGAAARTAFTGLEDVPPQFTEQSVCPDRLCELKRMR
jgi:hypothetical protein